MDTRQIPNTPREPKALTTLESNILNNGGSITKMVLPADMNNFYAGIADMNALGFGTNNMQSIKVHNVGINTYRIEVSR